MINDNELENLIDEAVKAAKTNGDLSAWKKNRALSPVISLISSLNSVPKTAVPRFDFSRVRNQILDRIAVPANASESGWFANLGISLPKLLSITAGSLAVLMVVVSLTLGTAVAALQSVPGQTIYPLKKVVENIELKFAPDDQKSILQLQFADNRVDEIQSVLDQQQQGQLTAQQTQKIVSATVKDLQQTTAAAAKSANSQPRTSAIVNKLADLTSKLKSASIHTDGEVKIEIEKAVQSTQISQDQAIKNIENAGIKLEAKPISIDNTLTATGKLTAVSDTSVSIGTAKFLITKDTVYVGITAAKDLAVDQLVDIQGQIKDNKTYAQKITLISDQPKTDTPETDTNTGSQ